jgi:hypothetical protein
MSMFYASTNNRRPIWIFRDKCEMVAASSEISLEIAVRGLANSRPFGFVVYTILYLICSLGNQPKPNNPSSYIGG